MRSILSKEKNVWKIPTAFVSSWNHIEIFIKILTLEKFKLEKNPEIASVVRDHSSADLFILILDAIRATRCRATHLSSP